VQANADLSDLKKLNNPKSGCLADKPDSKSRAPRFAFRDGERSALRAFLSQGLVGAGSPAPAHAAHADLRRYNCLACHSRDGEGGLTPDMIDVLRRHAGAENAEAVTPPPLTGMAHKLRTPWARQVLTGAGRARPWMSLRMPQYGAAQVGRLPEALAALEGTDPDDTTHKIAPDPKKIEAGRVLVANTALACVSCHDIAGVVTGATRGPDLALMNQRVRYDWYVRWLDQAQRMQPGTRMPEMFMTGKSLYDKLYQGDAALQTEAIWAYLSLGPKLPLPEGVKPRKD
jgi:cytochrome c553